MVLVATLAGQQETDDQKKQTRHAVDDGSGGRCRFLAGVQYGEHQADDAAEKKKIETKIFRVGFIVAAGVVAMTVSFSYRCCGVG